MVESVQTFYKELSPILEKHRDKLGKLVDGTQTSKVTAWRWLNGINTKYPDPNKLLSVLAKESGKSTKKQIGEFFGGEILEYLKKSFPFDFLKGQHIKYIDKDSFKINDFYSYVILAICSTKRGASKKELKNTIGNIVVRKIGLDIKEIKQASIDIYGELAKHKIEDLIALNYIHLGEDERYYMSPGNVSVDVLALQEFLPDIIRYVLKPEEFPFRQNAFYTFTESIPASIATEIAEDTRIFYTKIYEKMNKHKSKEGIPYTVMNLAERICFDFKNDSEKKELQ